MSRCDGCNGRNGRNRPLRGGREVFLGLDELAGDHAETCLKTLISVMRVTVSADFNET